MLCLNRVHHRAFEVLKQVSYRGPPVRGHSLSFEEKKNEWEGLRKAQIKGWNNTFKAQTQYCEINKRGKGTFNARAEQGLMVRSW